MKQFSGSFSSDVIDSIRVWEVLMILSVPVLLSGIFLLPESIQSMFILNYASPSPTNLLSSAYVHWSFQHLLNNLASALLFIPIYLLLALSGERKLFAHVFIFFLLVVPMVISFINILVIAQGSGAGFSGVGSAIIGMLPVTSFVFIHNRISESIRPWHAIVVYMMPFTPIAYLHFGLPAAAGMLVVSGALVISYLRTVGTQEWHGTITTLASSKGYFLLNLFVVLVFLASPIILFPPTPEQGDIVVNILSHHIGFVIGFFGPTIYVLFR